MIKFTINNPVIRILMMFLVTFGTMPIFKWVLKAGENLKHHHPGDGMAMIVDAMLFCGLIYVFLAILEIAGIILRADMATFISENRKAINELNKIKYKIK